MRKAFLFFALFCYLSINTSFSLPNFSVVNLRGYGRVQATIGGGIVKFLCENPEKADILLGKLLADLFWDAKDKHLEREVSLSSGKKIKIHIYPPFGCIALGRKNNLVLGVGGNTEEEVIRKIKENKELLSFFSSDIRFSPEKPYPIYLDFYDLRAFKSYTHAMSSPHQLGVENHWKFVKDFSLGGLATQYTDFQFTNPAPGVFELVPADYEVKEAEKNKGLYVICFNFGGNVPLWFYNKYSQDMMGIPENLLLGGWGREGAAGAHYESWGISYDKRKEGGLRFAEEVMKRYVKSPSLGGWHIYAGAPGGEMSYHSRTTAFYDFSPLGEENFRDYLRKVKGYTLKQLGERWYGDANHFKSWKEVKLPNPFSFYADLDGSFVINRNWKWHKAETDNPPQDDNWIRIEMPPSQEQLFLPWTSAFFKTIFDCRDWLNSNKGKDIYLVCNLYAYDGDGTSVWLNGKFLGKFKSPIGLGPFSLKVNGELKEGFNELVLKVPGEGKIFGPILLTAKEPRFYPYLGKGKNAMFVDFKEWQIHTYCSYHIPGLELARRIDPDRPIILSPDQNTAGYALNFAERYGLGLQFTGQGGWYYPWWTGYGYLRGIYGTSEPGGTIEEKWMDRMMGWILINGESNFNLFWTLEDYMKMEKETGWFSKHKRLVQLFGKSIREKPRIVIFRPTLEMLLDPQETFWVWDIGRGELQASHYDNLYATEEDLARGLVNEYPVLFDCGTTIMDDKMIEAIRKYVEQGGTFIALHNTGRHSLLEPDSWPISKLTGLKVISTDKRGRLRFEANIPIFRGWEGKEFEGEGTALDYRGKEFAKGVGIAMKPEGKDVIPIARWEDGSIAIGYTRLGRGKIIVLGSTFWRSGKDISGVWVNQSELQREFFWRLFSDLGIERNANSSSADIWTRKFITKNGLEEWLIAFNSSSSTVKANISFRVNLKPNEVWDKVEEKAIDFTCEDGWVKIKDLKFNPFETKVFAVKRADIADAISYWWWEKTTYWKASEIPKKFETKPKESLEDVICFDKWRFYPDKDGVVSGREEWKYPDYDDSCWKVVPSTLWNLIPKLSSYKGIGLYRAKFRIPKEWQRHRIMLELYSFDHPIIYNSGQFFINGKEVAKYQQRGWSQTFVYDITDYLREGENVLAIKVQGGDEFFTLQAGGICGSIFLFPALNLSPSIDLSGKWKVLKGDFRGLEETELPGRARGKCLIRDIEIPEDWKGKEIYIQLEIPQQWLRSIAVNGRLINYNSYLHPFGTISEVNITPYIKPGELNRIELWPATIATFNEEDMEVNKIVIGCKIER